jgi:hypothetical protein
MGYPALVVLLGLVSFVVANAQQTDEDRQFLEDSLKDHAGRIGRLAAEHQAARKRFESVATAIGHLWAERRAVATTIARSQDGRTGNEEIRSRLRNRAREAQRAAANAAAAANSAALRVSQGFRDADSRLAGCASAQDAAAIDALLGAAVQGVGDMERSLEQARTEAAVLTTLGAEHARLVDVVTTLRGEYIAAWKRWEILVSSMESAIRDFSTALSNVREVELRLKSQHRESSDRREFFARAFPESGPRWDVLLAKIPAEQSEPLARRLADSERDAAKLRQEYNDFTASAGFDLDRPWAAPGVESSIEAAEAEMNAARLAFMSLGKLRAGAAECRRRAGAQSLELLGERPDGLAPRPRVGLKISGKAEVNPGQLIRFVALDESGEPYASGVEWNSTVEDVVVIDRATGSATGFKPGKSVVIAKVEGMTAFFAVTVTPAPGQDGAAPASGEGFADLGGSVRQVEDPAAATPPPAQPDSEDVQRRMVSEAAQHQAALAEQRRAAAEEARINELRRSRDAEQQRAAGQLWGAMAGMNQAMEDIKNRGRRGGGTPAPTPTPQGNFPGNLPIPVTPDLRDSGPQGAGGGGQTTPMRPGISTTPGATPSQQRGCSAELARYEGWVAIEEWDGLKRKWSAPSGRPSVLAIREIPCSTATTYRSAYKFRCPQTGEIRCSSPSARP